jgi:hypothetical protein
VSRQRLVWLLTVPLAVAGSQLAHALAYRLAVPDADRRSLLLAATGHGYYAHLPLALALGSVFVGLALAAEIRHLGLGRQRAARGPSAVTFAVLAPAIFCFQEHFERLVHHGGFPWSAVLQPTFVVGLLLQLPFALAAYLVARLLLGAARSVARWLSMPRRPCVASAIDDRPTSRVLSPHVPALALGYGTRGPPSPSR